MAFTIPTKWDTRGRVIEMRSSPSFTYDTAFDSYLLTHENGSDNFTLTLVLKLHLHQVTPTVLNLPWVGSVQLPYLDWDKTPFMTKPWTAGDFAAFVREFRRQCGHWNDKFWLTPPAGFTSYDYKLGGRTVRPNVYCHLYIDLVAAGAAHRTFEVVNLDTAAAARQLGKAENALNASDFRSDSATYDSLDVKPVPIPFTDETGRTHSRMNRSTVAHEIGHVLGLPHSGVSQSAPLCTVAQLTDTHFPAVTTQASFPALFKGGSNSNACYGHYGPLRTGSNVMGFGLEFDATNAQPWLDRIALHTGTKATDWQVSVKVKVPPKHL